MKSHFLDLNAKTVSKWTQEETKAMMESYQHYFNEFQPLTMEAEEKRKITVREGTCYLLDITVFSNTQLSRATRQGKHISLERRFGS